MFAGKNRDSREKEIYYQYAEYLLAVCYRYLGNRELAQEVMHDGFLKAFKHYAKFVPKHENSLKYWLKKIMINESLMYLRKHNNFEPLNIEAIQELEVEYQHDTFKEQDILKLVAGLPTGYRTVFNLFALEGYSHAEIATQLNIKESTSRSQLTMARKLLKEKLIEIGYETPAE